MEVVSVKVLVRRRCGEEEIKKFEDKQLEGSFALSIQEKDNVLAEGFISRPLSGKDLHDSVRQRRTWGVGLIWARVVSGAHILLVQYELNGSANH